MSVSLYDLSVGTFSQTVSGAIRVLDKGRKYAEDNDFDPDTFVGMRVHDDMLPFLFQVNCIKMHSVGCLNALRAGEMSPPKSTTQRNYQELQQMLADIQAELASVSADEINGFADSQVIFKFGGQEIPFTAANYIQSFAIPNLQFHAATTYDILRAEGVPLGKADFLGQMRVGV